MRTTLTIDDDLAGLLRQKAEKSGLPFRDVLNQTLRQGLHVSHPVAFHGVKTRPHAFGFKPGVDLDRINQLADELEATEVLDRLRS